MTETPKKETESAQKFRGHAIAEAADTILTEISLRLKPEVKKAFDESLRKAIKDHNGAKPDTDVKLDFALDVLNIWEDFEEAGALI